ncbi:hypothetical protein JZU51_01600 [bacterium]|nr:hypothetical protein [bacterium]
MPAINIVIMTDSFLSIEPSQPALSRSSTSQKAGDYGTARLSGTGALDELKRSPKQFEILLIVRRVGSIDLNPLPRTCHPAGLKWNDVASRELQFGRGGGRHTQSNAVSTYTGEHLVVDEKGVNAKDDSIL